MLDSKVQTALKGLLKQEPQARIDIYLGWSQTHAGNTDLVLNLSLAHASPQHTMAFNNEFALIPVLHVKVVPSNQANLVEKSSESASDADVKTLKIRFNQHHNNLLEPDSDFAETFDSTNLTRLRIAATPFVSPEPAQNKPTISERALINPLPVLGTEFSSGTATHSSSNSKEDDNNDLQCLVDLKRTKLKL